MKIKGKDVLLPEGAPAAQRIKRLGRGDFDAALAGGGARPPAGAGLGAKVAMWAERAANRPPCPHCGEVFETQAIDGTTLKLRVLCPHEAADDARIAREADAKAQANARFGKLRDRIGKLKLPNAYGHVRLADLDDDPRSLEGKQTVAMYLETLPERLAGGEGIMALGNVGTGKSYVLAALVNELGDRQVAAMMVTAGEMQKRLTDFSKLPSGESRADAFYTLASEVDVLVIDDLGTESRLTTYMVGELFNLINARFQEKRPTCFTSNLAVMDQVDGLSSLVDRFMQGLQAARQADDTSMSAEDAALQVERIIDRLDALNVAVPFIGASRRRENRPTWNRGIRA